MAKRRAVVTGLGVVAPNGIGTDEFWQSSIAGRSGIDRVTTFDASDLDSQIAGQVTGFDPLDYVPSKVARGTDRFAQLGLVAAQMALDDSGLDLEREDSSRIGTIVGSGLGGVLFHEEQMMVAYERGKHRVNPLCVPRITPNAVSSQIAIRHGLLGPNMVISTACASGTHAIGEALRKIQGDETDIVFTGGAEAPLTPFTFAAFSRMRVLSSRNDAPQKASRPFDRKRDGFVLAEGAAVLVLEELGHALRRGAHIYAEVVGYGMSCGAHHMVIPDPTGRDAAMAMRLALSDADIGPPDVSYVNAHGTSTESNDPMETRAVKDVFGDLAFQIPLSSTKSMTGHAIGAAGAIEAAVCCLTIKHQIICPTINYEEPDEACDLDYVPNRCREADVAVAMSNSFGFGSVNAVLLFAQHVS